MLYISYHFMRVCTNKKVENKKFLPNPHINPYSACIRVITEIISGKKSFSSFLFVQTLIKWSYLVHGLLVVVQYFLSYCYYSYLPTS